MIGTERLYGEITGSTETLAELAGGRIPPGDPPVEVLGDAAVLDELLAATPF
jgi:hypothetical protein